MKGLITGRGNAHLGGHAVHVNLPPSSWIVRLQGSRHQHPSELDVIFVWKDCSQNSHKDFRVRKLVVQRALLWLKDNNKYYHNIDINLAALNQLPDDKGWF